MANFVRKLIDSVSTYRNVETFIKEDLSIRRDSYYEEQEVEKKIKKQLVAKYGNTNVDNQHHIGGSTGLKCDIDLYDGKCGIEIKLADSLRNASELQRAIGQIAYYSFNLYRDADLILLVVGDEAEPNRKLDDLKKIIEQFDGVHLIYKQTKK